MEVLGPVTAQELGGQDVDSILLTLEAQGRILRGRFTPGAAELEWCDRRLLARIHRYTLSRLRAEIEPVSAADFLRFLLHWQHVTDEDQVRGAEGLAAVVEQLEGFEIAAAAWESDVLPARVADYGAEQLDQSVLQRPRDVGSSHAWQQGAAAQLADRAAVARARVALGVLAERIRSRSAPKRQRCARRSINKGASFFHELVAATGLVPAFVERGLAELAGAGVATADSFAGLRALLAPPDKRRRLIETAGRWSLLAAEGVEDIESIARTLLKRYGVVFRSLLQRETRLPAMARPRARLSAAGSARRDSRRALRRRLRRRAVRCSRRRRPTARGAQDGEDRRTRRAERRRPAQPDRYRHTRGARAGDPQAIGYCSRTASQSPHSKAVT